MMASNCVKAHSSAEILMVLSPAKTLDLSPGARRLSGHWTSPNCNEAKTKQIAAAMKIRTAKELEGLLGISSNLATTAHKYWSTFNSDKKDYSDLKPCIFSFSGAAYQGLNANDCSDSDILYMQRNLRIIDPLYGILRPLDLAQPYRLEMASKRIFPDDEKIKLAEYWKTSVSEYLAADLILRDSRIVLNLASDEYSAAVDASILPDGTRYVKVIFWDGGRTIAVHAKRARGLMVRYLSTHMAATIADVQKFDAEGYSFVESKSDETTLVFDRNTRLLAPKKKMKADPPMIAEVPTTKRSRRR